jgi:radical SAM protein with 4Fe4S-binding SPASM domain
LPVGGARASVYGFPVPDHVRRKKLTPSEFITSDDLESEGSQGIGDGEERRVGFSKEFREFWWNLLVPKKAIKVRHPFGIFNIELTNHCPFRCVMCARTNNMTRNKGHMEFEVFQKIIDELVTANPNFVKRKKEIWLHHFGESLVHPEVGRFVRYAVDRGLYVGLSINPLMLKEKKSRELLEANPGILLVSLDGYDDESFFRIRGVKNAYEKSKANLLRFLEMKKQMGSKTKVQLHMINFPSNDAYYLDEDNITKTIAFWESLEGIDEFFHKNFSTWDGNARDVNALAAVASFNEAPVQQLGKVTCNNPWWRMTVAWDGDVLPCCMDYNKRLVLGNIKEQTLTEIWNGGRMRELRREFLGNHVTNPLCRNCDGLRSQK